MRGARTAAVVESSARAETPWPVLSELVWLRRLSRRSVWTRTARRAGIPHDRRQLLAQRRDRTRSRALANHTATAAHRPAARVPLLLPESFATVVRASRSMAGKRFNERATC